ncbi:hypothetical protein D3C81_1273910 [compost metagenome]
MVDNVPKTINDIHIPLLAETNPLTQFINGTEINVNCQDAFFLHPLIQITNLLTHGDHPAVWGFEHILNMRCGELKETRVFLSCFEPSLPR